MLNEIVRRRSVLLLCLAAVAVVAVVAAAARGADAGAAGVDGTTTDSGETWTSYDPLPGSDPSYDTSGRPER